METFRLGKNTNTQSKVNGIQLKLNILPDFLFLYNEPFEILGDIGKVVACGGTRERSIVSKYGNVYHFNVLDSLNFTLLIV